MMTNSGLRILLVEDNPADVLLVRTMLREEGLAFELLHAETLTAALARLDSLDFDLVLLDLSLPGSDGLDTYLQLRAQAHLPTIVLSGSDDEALALRAVEAGAQDYLVKGRVQGKVLARAIHYAVERARAERKLREAEERYRTLFEDAPVMYVITHSEDGKEVVIDCNRLFLEALGYERSQVLGRPLSEHYVDPESGVTGDERRILAGDGRVIETLIRTVPEVDAAGRPSGVRVTFLDVTDRKRAEQALRQSESRTRALYDAIPDLIIRIGKDGTYGEMKPPRDFNPLLSAEEVIGKTVFEVLPRDVAGACSRARERAVETGDTQVVEYDLLENGSRRYYEARLVPGEDGDVLAIVRDVTDRKELEAQLWQSQKMEAVGTLAGGIAHDFNNLLTVIGGYSELILMELAPDDSKRADVVEIKKSADRAADLTRQLLAFSRRQVLQPRLLDLNQVVEELTKLLRRLIVENIELKMSLDPSLGRVKADPAQIEQILVNLAVNARDAMPLGGTLTIETGNVDLDERYIKNHPRVEAGRYAMLAVSDTGHGIPKDIQTRIFEPFFTTKPPGSGTGLGLSTVYGIVHQSGGFIFVDSAPGEGATFSIVLPEYHEDAKQAAAAKAAARPAAAELADLTGAGTVLLVEDEDAVRMFGARALRNKGYKVLEATNGEGALDVINATDEPIDLLISDVVMPGIDGHTLVRLVRHERPGVKVILMSGYAEDAFRDEISRDPSIQFLAKPFSLKGLASKVKEVMAGKAPAA